MLPHPPTPHYVLRLSNTLGPHSIHYYQLSHVESSAKEAKWVRRKMEEEEEEEEEEEKDEREEGKEGKWMRKKIEEEEEKMKEG
ncbi:X-linked retinitis pigmentosa GTPase regulator-interacting protein 1, partial [Ophiophagus hannah]